MKYDTFVNSGVGFGRLGKMCQFVKTRKNLQNLLEDNCNEDQGLTFITMILTNQWVKLDELGFVITMVKRVKEDFEKVNNTDYHTQFSLFDLKTQRYPFVLHMNGKCYKHHFNDIRNTIYSKDLKEKVKNMTFIYEKKTVRFVDVCDLDITQEIPEDILPN